MIEIFLRSFVNIEQNQCIEPMHLAKFAYNTSLTSAHGMMPIYAIYVYHPSAGTAPIETNTLPVSSGAYGH
jgi:hypothetical protein